MYRLELLEYPLGMMEALERKADALLSPHRHQTIFPRFEALLGLGAYQDALGFVADRAAMKTYRHLTDFALCELFPEYAGICAAFYEGGGSQLKDRWTIEESRRCERAMLCLLGIAKLIREEHQERMDATCRVSWTTLTRVVRQIMDQAPRPPDGMPQ
jgi:hypothetical protein